MRLEDGRVLRLERHLTRMKGSAGDLGFAWDERRVRAVVEEARSTHAQNCWRLRLLLDRSGTPTTTCTPHADEPRVWRVAFAREPVDSADALLRHKTTRRALYDDARHAQPHMD